MTDSSPSIGTLLDNLSDAEFASLTSKWSVVAHIEGDNARLRELLPYAWANSQPSALSVADWRDLFRAAGFLSDDPDTLAPTETMDIYRGAWWGARRRMSWTLDAYTALQFAKRINFATGRPTHVFRTRIEPDGVLAILKRQRNEAEVVVDPMRLPTLTRASILTTCRINIVSPKTNEAVSARKPRPR